MLWFTGPATHTGCNRPWPVVLYVPWLGGMVVRKLVFQLARTISKHLHILNPPDAQQKRAKPVWSTKWRIQGASCPAQCFPLDGWNFDMKFNCWIWRIGYQSRVMLPTWIKHVKCHYPFVSWDETSISNLLDHMNLGQTIGLCYYSSASLWKFCIFQFCSSFINYIWVWYSIVNIIIASGVTFVREANKGQIHNTGKHLKVITK